MNTSKARTLLALSFSLVGQLLICPFSHAETYKMGQHVLGDPNHDGIWYPGVITEISGAAPWYRIKFDAGHPPKLDEMVTLEAYVKRAPGAPAAAAPAASAGSSVSTLYRPGRPSPTSPGQLTSQPGSTRPISGGLDGLYLRMQMAFNSIQEEYFYFTPDGKVYQGVPTEFPFNWAAAAAREPKQVGTYSLSGDKITLNWGGGWPAATMRINHVGVNLELDGKFARKALPFPGGTRFSGAYTGGRTVAGGGAAVGAGGTWYFNADGTYRHGAAGGTNTDSARAGTSAGALGSNAGTYSISGNMLTLTGGRNAGQHHIYPINFDGKGSLQDPQRLGIDGTIYKKL